jgi:hypothetical protein
MKAYAWLGAVGVFLASGTALAQQVYVTGPPPPPPPQVYVNAPPPPGYGYGYGRPGPGYYGPGDLDRPRLRLAFGVTGGPYIGDNIGGAGGFWGQAGVQINRLIAVYYQTHAMLGAVGSRSNYDGCGGDSLSCSFFGGIWLNEIMIDFTIQDVLQLGVGPSFDLFSVNNFTEGFPGLDARIGVALGRRGRWRRTGFMLGLDVHPTFITDNTFPTSSVATAVLLTLGGGWY